MPQLTQMTHMTWPEYAQKRIKFWCSPLVLQNNTAPHLP